MLSDACSPSVDSPNLCRTIFACEFGLPVNLIIIFSHLKFLVIPTISVKHRAEGNCVSQDRCAHTVNRPFLLAVAVPALKTPSLRSDLCRTVCTMSCPLTQMRFSNHRQRLTSNIWMRASSQEVPWIRTSWRWVTSCCEFIFLYTILHMHTWASCMPNISSTEILFPLPGSRPLERGWRKAKDVSLVQPKMRLKQEVVSVNSQQQQRGQRIVVPVKKLFAREKRPYGLGMVGRLTNRTYRKRIDSFTKRQIEDMDDHRWSSCWFYFYSEDYILISPGNGAWQTFSILSRPFFTYWITFVHLLITILAMTIYRIAPVGFSQHETVDSVSAANRIALESFLCEFVLNFLEKWTTV